LDNGGDLRPWLGTAILIFWFIIFFFAMHRAIWLGRQLPRDLGAGPAAQRHRGVLAAPGIAARGPRDVPLGGGGAAVSRRWIQCTPRVEQDFYATLGVKPGASKDDIKAAYRKAAMKWHPDR